jgi:hypothetical protein
MIRICSLHARGMISIILLKITGLVSRSCPEHTGSNQIQHRTKTKEITIRMIYLHGMIYKKKDDPGVSSWAFLSLQDSTVPGTRSCKVFMVEKQRVTGGIQLSLRDCLDGG